jgi:2'-5' RNA ligase
MDGVMIAFLPNNADFTNVELPHMTLVYAGTKQELSPGDFNSIAKDAATVATLLHPFALRVSGSDIFGEGTTDNPTVRVLKLRPSSEIMAARRIVERWNKSTHPFNPHVTIGPATHRFDELEMPRFIGFDRVYVGWGDESLTFWLR